MRVHPDKPFVGDLCFDDTWGMSVDQVNFLASRGVVFSTSWKNEGHGTYGGLIVAPSWADAENIAEARGLGEKVEGQLGELIPADENGAPLKRNWRPDEDHDLRGMFGL